MLVNSLAYSTLPSVGRPLTVTDVTIPSSGDPTAQGIFYQAMKPADMEELKSAVECAFEKIERENLRERVFPLWVPRRVPA